MGTYKLAVVIEKDAEGYFAYCPQLQGCYSQGDTYEEALSNIQDAVQLILEDLAAQGEPIPSAQNISLTTLEVVM